MSNNNLRVYDNILDLLPSVENPTPLVKINKLNPFKNIEIYAKLEWYNPFGAVKDRIAVNLLNDAASKGLTNEKKLVEPTSGNTGIGLIQAANLKGFNLRTPLSSAIPEEKKTILRFLGSEVIEIPDTLCPDPTSPDGAIGTAKTTVQNFPDKFHMLNQYENIANPEAHYATTGPEIWKQTEGKITHFVSGLGTCGTISGVGKFLKEKNPDIKIIGVHPDEGHEIPGVRSIKQLVVTKFYTPKEYDGTIEISNKEAYDLCLRLNREEGIIAGPSSGMALAGALKVLEKEQDAHVVIIFPDNIFKYASFFMKNFPDIIPSVAKESSKLLNVQDVTKDMVEKARTRENTIEVDEAKEIIENENCMVIDVRPSFIYTQGHVPKAINFPLQELTDRISELPKEKKIITICGQGNASLSALLVLKSRGFNDIKSMNSGTMGWKEKGYVVE